MALSAAALGQVATRAMEDAGGIYFFPSASSLSSFSSNNNLQLIKFELANVPASACVFVPWAL